MEDSCNLLTKTTIASGSYLKILNWKKSIRHGAFCSTITKHQSIPPVHLYKLQHFVVCALYWVKVWVKNLWSIQVLPNPCCQNVLVALGFISRWFTEGAVVSYLISSFDKDQADKSVSILIKQKYIYGLAEKGFMTLDLKKYKLPCLAVKCKCRTVTSQGILNTYN